MRKIVGFRKFTSKKGLASCVVYLQSDFSASEIDAANSYKGIKCESVMLFGDDSNIITDAVLGKELVGYYGYYKGSLSIQSPAIK